MEQTIKFTAPVFIGDTITATATVQEFMMEKRVLKLLTECHNQKFSINRCSYNDGAKKKEEYSNEYWD